MSAAHRSFLSIGYLIGVFVAALLATTSVHAQGSWIASMGMTDLQDSSDTWLNTDANWWNARTTSSGPT